MSRRRARVGQPKHWKLLCLCLLPLLALAEPANTLLLEKSRHALLLDIAQAGERLVAVGDRGHVLVSDDRGEHWALAAVPVERLLTAVFFIDDTHGWAVGHEALVLVTRDGGQSWQVQHDGMAAASEGDTVSPLLDVWFADAKTGWAVGSFGLVLHTRDGGEHWEDWSQRVDNPEGMHINAVNGLPTGVVMMAGESGLLMRSVDHGEHWQQIPMAYDGSLFGLQRFAGQWLAFGLRGHAYASDDGVDWQPIALPLSQTLFAAAASNGRVFLVGQGGTVLAATDMQSWHVLQKEQGDHLTGALQQGHRLWMVGQGGLHTLDVPGEQP